MRIPGLGLESEPPIERGGGGIDCIHDNQSAPRAPDRVDCYRQGVGEQDTAQPLPLLRPIEREPGEENRWNDVG